MVLRCLLSALVLMVMPVAAPGASPIHLGPPAELLKLPQGQAPYGISGRQLIRLSPKGDRFIYIRLYDQRGRAKLHLRQVGSPDSDSPVVWDEPIPALYCQMAFAGFAWRADGQRVLFAQEPGRDEDGWAQDVFGRAMRPWGMYYDLPNPQCKRCQHMAVDGATGCTSLSFSPDGKTLWTAFSDPAGFRACGITGWSEQKDRGFSLYAAKGAAIYWLAPSSDGTKLAWLETFPRISGQQFRGAEVVIFDIEGRKAVERIVLSRHVPGWPDAQMPVWTLDSKALCYGDVVEVEKAFRREVRLWNLADGGSEVLLRDAIAVGAAPQGIILNRGPACQPMAALLSSFAPPGGPDLPRVDEMVLCRPGGRQPPVSLLAQASAQQVVGETVVYAQTPGSDVVVMRARLVVPASRPSGSSVEPRASAGG